MKKILINLFLFISLFAVNITYAEVNNNNNTVIATGYGISYDASLNNAFRDAIKQFVGIVLDSETILANNEIIKDEILTLSNGNIESYEVINKTEEDGLFIVEIKAIVKNRNIQNKISEKISLSTNTQLDTNKIAEVITKRDTELDQKVLFEKYVTSFFKDNYDNLLYINNITLDVKEDSYRDNKVDYNLSFSVNFDIQKYKEAITTLKENLNNIGITHHKRFFINDAAIHNDYLDQRHFDQCSNRGEKVCLAIADYIAGKYVYDLYIIDSSDSSLKASLRDLITPDYNGYSSSSKSSDYLNLFFEISSNNETLDLFSTTKLFDGFSFKNERGVSIYRYLGDFYSAYVSVFLISPNFISNRKSLPSVNLSYQGTLHINDIDSLGNISTKVELSK